MKFRFSLLIGISAFLLASCAAYYSVFGLSKMFAGASLAVILMASSLEIAKLITAATLHNYWDKLSGLLKLYLTIGVIVLITITSAGIYGFLTSAYQETSFKMQSIESNVLVLENKKTGFNQVIENNDKNIETKNKRLEQLTEIRLKQEDRIDSAKTNYQKKIIRQDIELANKEISQLRSDIDELYLYNTALNDSINNYNLKILELNNNEELAGEIGPLKYIANLTGLSIDGVVNIYVLLLIFVFDPLAVSLVIVTNRVIQLEKKNNNNLITIETDIPVITEELLEEQENIETINEIEVQPETRPKININDIKEKKEETKRGFSVDIPKNRHIVSRIGTNKYNTDDNNIIFKK